MKYCRTMEGLAGSPAQVASLNGPVAPLALQSFRPRDDGRAGFAAVRQEIVNGKTELRREIETGNATLPDEVSNPLNTTRAGRSLARPVPPLAFYFNENWKSIGSPPSFRSISYQYLNPAFSGFVLILKIHC